MSRLRLGLMKVGLVLQAVAMVGITMARASDPPWTVLLSAAIVITLGAAYPSGWPAPLD